MTKFQSFVRKFNCLFLGHTYFQDVINKQGITSYCTSCGKRLEDKLKDVV